MIKWENVRKELLELPCYRAQRRLKTWINSPHIQTIDVEYNIDEQQKMLKKYDKEKKKFTSAANKCLQRKISSFLFIYDC